MKIPKLALVIGAIVLVLAIALGFHFYMKAKIGLAVATEHAAQAQLQVTALSAQLVESHAVNAQIEAALDASQQAAAAQQAAFLVALGKLTTATPAQLVDQGGQVIGATDITLSANGQIVSMGVETYRKFVIAAVSDQNYKTVKEPEWNAREVLYQKDISQYKANEILYDRRDALNNGIIKDLRSVISKQKTTSTLEKVVWSAAGFGAGVLADKLIK